MFVCPLNTSVHRDVASTADEITVAVFQDASLGRDELWGAVTLPLSDFDDMRQHRVVCPVQRHGSEYMQGELVLSITASFSVSVSGGAQIC